MATADQTADMLHPEAVSHLPPFIVHPGDTDVWLSVMGVFLVLILVGIGVFYLKLHALPEHMAHRGQKVQFEFVAVLALIALFTHNHAFWIAGLLIAMIPFPDFVTPLTSMARSLGKMAGYQPDEALIDATPPDAIMTPTEGIVPGDSTDQERT